MLSKKELEIIVEKIPKHPNPKDYLEQYTTPAKIVAKMIHYARLLGDLENSIIIDLGCGTGRFAIAASLYGNTYAIGIDIDKEAVHIAREYSKKLGAIVDFILCDVKFLKIRGDVVFQNPPFGIKKKHADRVFLEKATEISNVIYTIHDKYSKEFVLEFLNNKGFYVTHTLEEDFEIPLQFYYHKARIKRIPVIIFRAEKS
ncbi:MAG TPA: methyltransferase domain-containing protein [Euryarchaeota archaeon]|nr:methyltransferase domain-containing protein [Euryarchaeota archaeon]